ncbi:MAG: cupin domain-containing protein [Ginsengibacter sp.]
MKEFVNPKPDVMRQILHDDGQFPNSGLFLLIYKQAFLFECTASEIEETFARNNWTNSWRNGIFDYHHYHSTTHEVMGVYEGSASVQFGGPGGIVVTLQKGDVIVIPAGVAHKCMNADDYFKCVGAYPDGKDYDILKGKSAERPAADENINNVPLPDVDPVYGSEGPVMINWEIQ